LKIGRYGDEEGKSTSSRNFEELRWGTLRCQHGLGGARGNHWS
jgi:hypothetical protein